MTTISLPVENVYDPPHPWKQPQVVITPDIQAQILAPLLARVAALERRLGSLNADLRGNHATDLPKPVDAGPAEPEATRKCPACGDPVLHRYSQSLKSWMPIQYHDCKFPLPATPPAADPTGDDVAVGIIAGIMSTYGVNANLHPGYCAAPARAILAAIRRGKIKGVKYVG
jgi:hypothetical protein